MIQRKATSSFRATIVSIYSSIGNLLYFIVSLVFTLFSASLSVSLISMLIFSIVIVIGFACLVRNNRNGQKKEEEKNPFLPIFKRKEKERLVILCGFLRSYKCYNY